MNVIVANNLPSLSGPSSKRWTVGEQSWILLTITDPDPQDTVHIATDFLPPSLPTSRLVLKSSAAPNTATYNYSWTPQSRSKVVMRYR